LVSYSTREDQPVKSYSHPKSAYFDQAKIPCFFAKWYCSRLVHATINVKYSYDSPWKALQNPHLKFEIQLSQQKLLTKNQFLGSKLWPSLVGARKCGIDFQHKRAPMWTKGYRLVYKTHMFTTHIRLTKRDGQTDVLPAYIEGRALRSRFRDTVFILGYIF